MPTNENPLVNEGIGTRIVNAISRNNSKNSAVNKERGMKASTLTAFIGMNNAIPICAEACACCWDKQVPEGYENVAEYVAKRSRTGHTSIIEHSNFIMGIRVGNYMYDDLATFLSTIRYLRVKIIEDISCKYVIFYGSFRAYADLYRNTDDLNNMILKSITNMLYQNANSAAFEDICALGLLDKSSFKNPDVTLDSDYYLVTDPEKTIDTDLFKVIGADSLKRIYNNIIRVFPEVAGKLSVIDLCEMGSITILFKNMSRTCTHQLVRHRNAITQESQRYVDYSNACFNSPALFKPEKYDKDHKYKIRFGPCSPVEMTLEEIGQAMCEIYGQLHNPAITGANYALMREDARAFLPSNVQCKKIYMTFTYKSLLKFLNLREDPHAQAEIRMYATAIGDWFRNNSEFTTKELCDLYTMPRLLIEDPIHIDVDLGTTEEKVNVTDEDYLKAAGLGDNSDNNKGE